MRIKKQILGIFVYAAFFQSMSSIFFDKNNMNYTFSDKINLENKSNGLFNWTRALNSFLNKSEKPAFKNTIDSLKKKQEKKSASANHKKKNAKKLNNIENLVDKLGKVINTTFQKASHTEPIIIQEPSTNDELVPSTSIKPRKAFCLKMQKEGWRKKGSVLYQSAQNYFFVSRLDCLLPDLLIPVPAKSHKNTFYLISAKNGLALTESEDQRILLERKSRGDDQVWVFIDDGEMFRVYNLGSKNLMALDGFGQMITVRQGGRSGVHRKFFVDQSAGCRH